MSEDDSTTKKTLIVSAPTEETKTPHGGRRFVSGDVILGRYVVESELGQGGMGVVYKCLDKVGGVKVAVKGLPPDVAHNEDEMEEIRANFQLVCDLRHENIAGVRTLEKDASGDYYLVMDLAHGHDLGSWMRKNKDADLKERLSIIRQIASALDYAHRRRVMHRDIKPGNIMVSPSGRVLLLDFGLAAQISTSLSRSSRMVVSQSGTPAYKSPEQWRGKPQGAAADQYALAVVAYRLLSGRLPFDGDNVLILCRAVLEERPPAIKHLPSHANKALAKALAKDPHDRFQSCTEFVDALEGKSQSGGFWRLLFVILLTVGALLAAGGAWLHFEKKRLLEERAAVEEAARKRVAAEEARRKAEEAARKKVAAEEARRKAEEAARKKVAAEEARLKAEEAARKRVAAEEARRKAEEEARLKAEEEARLKAEEEARLKAEEAARKKAVEEEAKRKRAAEDEAKRQKEAEDEAKRQKETEDEAKRQKADAAENARKIKDAQEKLAAEQAFREKREFLERLARDGFVLDKARNALQPGTSSKIELPNGECIDMVWCPPGWFMMGSPETELERKHDERRHPVRLTKGFWIGKFEVTKGQWTAVMGGDVMFGIGKRQPMSSVNWEDCQNFMRQLKTVTGGKINARLPTEAEWEYACRAGTSTPFSFGRQLNGAQAACNRAAPYGTSEYGPVSLWGGVRDVGSFSAYANNWGINDMHGNVYEWCEDYFDRYPNTVDVVEDPRVVS